jgi:hypothetical protein
MPGSIGWSQTGSFTRCGVDKKAKTPKKPKQNKPKPAK